jgi:hypothetical protein
VTCRACGHRAAAGAVADVRGRYLLPENFIRTVGARRPCENHPILVRALASMPAHVSLVIVGQVDHSFPTRCRRSSSAWG